MSESHTSLGTAIQRHSVRLGAFAFGCAVLLAFAYFYTKDRIAFQKQEAERQSLNQILPAAMHDNDLLQASFKLTPLTSDFQQLELLGLSTARTAYRASLQEAPSGVILPLETAEGYSGTIVLVIGIDKDGVITGVRVLQHAETPGLGDKIDIRLSPWITSFDHRDLKETPEPLWRVKKDGGDFDQFVGATITPRAVVGAVHKALLFFEMNKDKLLQLPPRTQP